MRKKVFFILSLILAFTLLTFTVSCEMIPELNENNQNTEEDKENGNDGEKVAIPSAEELIKGKKAATGASINKSVLSSILDKNEDVLADLNTVIEDISALMENSDDITGATLEAVISAKDSSSTFSFATAEDYEALKKKYEKESAESTTMKYSLPADSALVPGSYREITVSLNYRTGQFEIKHKDASSDTFKTLDLMTFDNTDRLALDVMAVDSSVNKDNTTAAVFDILPVILEASSNSPDVKVSLTLSNSAGRRYSAEVSLGLSKDGRRIITADKITVNLGTAELFTLSCDASIEFSDDLSYIPYNEEKNTESVLKGSFDIRIGNIVFKMGGGKYVLKGTVAATVDLEKADITAYVAVRETIGALEIFNAEAGMKVKGADKVEDSFLNYITVYKCDILSSSYSSSSILKFAADSMGEDYTPENPPESETTDEYITFIYNLNGADSGTTPSSQKLIVQSDGSVRLKIADYSEITRTGYYLYGWNTKADGTGVNYIHTNGNYLIRKTNMSTMNDNNEVILYARWIKAEQDSDFIYTYLSESDSYSVLAPLKTNTQSVLTVPSSFNGKSVTEVYAYAFKYSEATSIFLPSSINVIEDNVFSHCTKLETFTIPDNVTRIQDGTYISSGLKSIEIPEGITEIGGQAFAYCNSLESVTLNNGLRTIDFMAFQSCKKLTAITFKGTKTQWETINKASDWMKDTPIKTIHCTDGDIAL